MGWVMWAWKMLGEETDNISWLRKPVSPATFHVRTNPYQEFIAIRVRIKLAVLLHRSPNITRAVSVGFHFMGWCLVTVRW